MSTRSKCNLHKESHFCSTRITRETPCIPNNWWGYRWSSIITRYTMDYWRIWAKSRIKSHFCSGIVYPTAISKYTWYWLTSGLDMKRIIVIIYKILSSSVYHYPIYWSICVSRNARSLIIYLYIKVAESLIPHSNDSLRFSVNIRTCRRYNNWITHLTVSDIFPSISCNGSCTILHHYIILISCKYSSDNWVSFSNRKICWCYDWCLI